MHWGCDPDIIRSISAKQCRCLHNTPAIIPRNSLALKALLSPYAGCRHGFPFSRSECCSNRKTNAKYELKKTKAKYELKRHLDTQLESYDKNHQYQYKKKTKTQLSYPMSFACPCLQNKPRHPPILRHVDSNGSSLARPVIFASHLVLVRIPWRPTLSTVLSHRPDMLQGVVVGTNDSLEQGFSSLCCGVSSDVLALVPILEFSWFWNRFNRFKTSFCLDLGYYFFSLFS
jgi:hypothetical protein